MRDDLILDRYEPLGTAGVGGFGTVQIAWDPRIQRKVAIKTIRLTALDAVRAALPGAQAVSGASTADRWHGVQPWGEFLEGESAAGSVAPKDAGCEFADEAGCAAWADVSGDVPANGAPADLGAEQGLVNGVIDQVTAMSHLPGLDEARTAAMLADPRIVTVYDFEVRGRMAYLIMEYVEGITLSDLLADYAEYLTLDMVACVFDSVAGALVAAHEAGVLHLDIKPDNILINAQGQVKVTDFGLATLADASGSGKTGGGTIGYMPPEQIRREELDARADEWSLASVTYEMLTGSNPFRVAGLDEAAAAIQDAELVLPSLCWKDVDEQIDDVVFYALDPNRDERYASVADFAEEALKFLGDPGRGSSQLQLVVEDALGLDDPSADGVEESTALAVAALPGADVASGDSPLAPRRSFTERFLDLLDIDEIDGASGAAGLEDGEEEQSGASRRGAKGASAREPLMARVPDFVLFIGSHAFGAVASGLLALLALANMQPLIAVLGPGAGYAVAVMAAVVAAVGAIRSHLGALVAYCLLGIAIVMCGHPIVGAVVLVLVVAWWYTIGHDGAASANVALLMPIAGAVGGATIVPFFAGASLKPLRALGTVAFAVAIAAILASFGSMSLLGWNASTYWDFGRADVSGAIMRLLTQPATWATIAGWVVATVALSLLRLGESKILFVLGVALALVAVLVGSLVLAGPTPQLIISAILASAVLVGVVV